MDNISGKHFLQTCQDEKINNAFKNLHENLVNEIVGFCKAYNITVDEIEFYADGLQDSIKFGKWHPSTDSVLKFIIHKDTGKENFLYSI